MTGLFGFFLTNGDLQPLRDRITSLDIDIQILSKKNGELAARLEALEKYCYSLGGDVALLRRRNSNAADGNDVTTIHDVAS